MPKENGVKRATQMETTLYAISSRSKERALSLEFLKLLCADQSLQQVYFERSQGASPLKGGYDECRNPKLITRGFIWDYSSYNGDVKSTAEY